MMVIETTTYSVLVNRQRCIKTLKDKAEITGYRLIRPTPLPEGAELFEVQDVDGLSYQTIIRRFPNKKDEIGVWVDSLAGKYHGAKSRHWKQEYHTAESLIELINNGYAVAPGHFSPPRGESHRSGDYCNYRDIILFDADEWTEEHPAPKDLSDFLYRYPTIADTFYWVGESISSRSTLKQGFRGRLMLLLPEPIHKGQDTLWETIVDLTVKEYPFIARGVGIDKVRLSFGNARPECKNRVLGGKLDAFEWETAKIIAKGRDTREKEQKAEKKRLKKERESLRTKQVEHKNRLNAAGIATPSAEMDNPLQVFCDIEPDTLLTKYGLATHLHGIVWNWHESGAGRSFEMENGVIKPFSNSVKAHNPNADASKPVNAHRLILLALYQLDMADPHHKHELRCKLADKGYGTHPDLFKQARSQEREKGREAGILPPPTQNREIRLTPSDVLSDIKREALELTQAFTQEVMNRDLSGQVFVIRIDTGGGKTEQAILIKGARPIILVGGHNLGMEIYNRARAKKVKAFLYRGLMHHQDGEFPFESPCIQPTVLDEYRKKGADAFRWGCEECPVIDICKKHGMRWQHEQLSDPDTLMILAIPQLFINPRYRSFLKNRLNLTANDIVLVDDASTENIFLDESISLEFLTEKIKIWKDTPLGEFAKAVKDIITENEAVSLITQLQSLVKSTLNNAPRRTTIYNQLKKSRHYDTHTKRFIEISLDDAIDKGFCSTKTTEDRQKLQTVEKEGWTTLDRLRIFFKAYPNPETAPMHYDKTENILHFTLPPQLFSTDAAVGFMGATLDADVFRSLFAKGARYNNEPQVYNAAETEWHPGAKAYQLRNNGNPRATLLKYKGQGELSATGLEFFECFKKFVEANPSQKHALITYKSVIEQYQLELDSLDVAYSWYHNTEGLDTRFADAEVYHVFGKPARDPFNVEWTAKVQGLSEDEIKDRLVSKELLQAIGRGRLVRKPNTIILYTSHKVDGFTDRCELTDEHDWHAADFQLSQLPAVISERQAQEKAHQEAVDVAIQSGDVQAVMDLTGKSKSTAYEITKESRSQKTPETKAEQDAARDTEIERILQNNPDTSYRQITEQLKTSGHKRTDRKYIKSVVDETKRGKIPADNIYVNCPSEKIRSSGDVFSEASVQEMDKRISKGIDDIIREYSPKSLIHSFFKDRKMHTAKEIAERTLIPESMIDGVLKEWYEKVMISPGVGSSYWMNDKDSDKCKAYIEKARTDTFQRFIEKENLTVEYVRGFHERRGRRPYPTTGHVQREITTHQNEINQHNPSISDSHNHRDGTAE